MAEAPKAASARTAQQGGPGSHRPAATAGLGGGGLTVPEPTGFPGKRQELEQRVHVGKRPAIPGAPPKTLFATWHSD